MRSRFESASAVIIPPPGRRGRGRPLRIRRTCRSRSASSSKSTPCPSNSGPSTQAKRIAPSTVTRHPPHMPVPSTMIGLSDTIVRTLRAVVGDGGDGSHHRHRSGGVDDIDRPRRDEVAEGIGDQSGSPGAAVVGAHDHLGERRELVLEQHALAGAGAEHGDHLDAELGESASDRKHHGGADPAGHAHRGALGRRDRSAGRADRRCRGCESPGASATRSDVLLPTAWMTSTIDPCAESLSAIVSGMRSAPGTEPDDHELTGLAYRGDPGRLTTSRCTSADSFVLEITSWPTGRAVLAGCWSVIARSISVLLLMVRMPSSLYRDFRP